MRRIIDNSIITVLITLLLLVASSPASSEDPPPFVLSWGSQGSGNNQFGTIAGVAIDQEDNVYVVDNGNNRIQKFNPSGGFLLAWGSLGSGDGQFDRPVGLAIDASNNVYVLDFNNYRVQKFSGNGNFLDSWGSFGAGAGEFDSPSKIAVDAVGNVFVSDVGITGNRIQKFTNSGTFILEWGSHGSNPGEFRNPRGMAVDTNGDIYVADQINDRIQKFTNLGTFILEFGTSGPLANRLDSPWDVGLDSNGNAYIAELAHQIQKRTGGGIFLTKWGTNGTGVGQFNSPAAVAVSSDGSVYVGDATRRIQKFGPGLGLRPVVLVHGYCGEPDMWDGLATYLTGQGFSVFPVDLNPSNGRPNVLAKELADFLDLNFPNQEVDIVAYSMGGLVTRQYIRQRKEDSRIKTLITLGTPHHGVDLVSIALRNKSAAWFIRETLYPCQLTGDGFTDLGPGSPFLNNLNYNSPNIGDAWLASSKGEHGPEIEYNSGSTVWTLVGTSGFDGPAYRITRNAWVNSPLAAITLGIDHLNDGVVGRDAAMLWRNLSQARIDYDMSLNPIQHTPGLGLYFDTRSFQNAQDLFPILENILRGGSIPGAPPSSTPASELAIHSTQAASDTVSAFLVSEDGGLNSNQVLERPFVLPASPLAQVTFVADSALFQLRKPGGTLLTPGDTSTVTGLHYIGDETIGIAQYQIENPDPGTWKAVFDASNANLGQFYALSVEMVSTTQVVLKPSTNVVYDNGTFNLRASLEESGTPITPVSWIVTGIRPDSTTFPVSVFDDGMHGDSLAADGIYGADIVLGPQLGFYCFDAEAVAALDSIEYLGVTQVELDVYHDLMTVGNLSISQNSTTLGDTVTISATVKNNGSISVDSITVSLWDNQVKKGEVLVALSSDQSLLAQFEWVVAAPDTHAIRITIDPLRLPNEISYENNSVRDTIVIGQPIVGVEFPLQALFSLGPVVPNPFIGSTTIHFAIPVTGSATIGAYDVAGRQLNRWYWENLRPGQHFVHWDGTTSTGIKLPPGIVFLRLQLNNQVKTSKTVILR